MWLLVWIHALLLWTIEVNWVLYSTKNLSNTYVFSIVLIGVMDFNHIIENLLVKQRKGNKRQSLAWALSNVSTGNEGVTGFFYHIIEKKGYGFLLISCHLLKLNMPLSYITKWGFQANKRVSQSQNPKPLNALSNSHLPLTPKQSSIASKFTFPWTRLLKFFILTIPKIACHSKSSFDKLNLTMKIKLSVEKKNKWNNI